MNENNKKGYSICPHSWALDKEIRNELGLLLIITSLCQKEGYCYASNKYFAELFGELEPNISRKLKKLEAKKYIEIVYEKRGFEITKRQIRLSKMIMVDYQIRQSTIIKNDNGTIIKNDKENIISNNNINNNKRESEERKNTHPSFSEVQDYIKQKELNVNPKQFYDYFEAGDWKDKNGNEVLNWKQKLLTWNRFEPKNKEQMKEEEIKARNERFLKGVRNNDTR